jgi:hypothetical protein
MAASYLYNQATNMLDWVVVRPGDLVDDDNDGGATSVDSLDYDVFDHPSGFLFGDNSVSRSDVADFMVRLSTMDDAEFRDRYNHKMPAIYGKKKKEEETTKPDEKKKL